MWGSAAILVVAIACGEPGPRNNPYDPLYPVTATMSGPDTLFSDLEVAQFNAQFMPSFPDTGITWGVGPVTVVSGVCDTTVDGSHFLQAAGAGAFRSIAPPLEPATVSITVAASVGAIDTTVSRDTIVAPCTPFTAATFVTIRTQQYRHSVYKTVIVMQRPMRIELRCPATHACEPVAVGGSWSVWVDGSDALGNPIHALASPTSNPQAGTPVATYASRDTTIASVVPVGVRAATALARKSGTTWIIATRGALVDSLQLVVK